MRFALSLSPHLVHSLLIASLVVVSVVVFTAQDILRYTHTT